jgi:RNA polymerase sigma-70 factor, ECF subfamily
VDERERPDLASILERHHGKVVGYAARLLGRDDADDVAREVFLKVGRGLPGLSDASRLTSWLYAIAANTVRDLAQACAAHASRISPAPRTADGDGDPLASVPDGTCRNGDEVVARNERAAYYLGFVERLPPNNNDVYALSELADFSIAEIAQRLSISVAAAKIRLHRARERLFGELRSRCVCYVNERGGLMGAPTGRAASGRAR